jgi:hypothetical protein
MSIFQIEDNLIKLEQTLDLVLNDVADNRDDTIISKLVDLLGNELKRGNSSSDQLKSRLCTYLEKNILNDQNFLIEKDSEVEKFFIELIRICVENTQTSNLEPFLNKSLNYFAKYFEENFILADFKIDSSVFCSILDYFSLVNRILNQNEGNLIDSCDLFHNVIFKKFLFTGESLQLFISTHFKSIFVRKSFKKLLVEHLINLIRKKLSHDASFSDQKKEEETVSFMFLNLSSLPDDIKLSNLDIEYELVKFYLFSNDDKTLNDVSTFKLLKNFHVSFFKFESSVDSSNNNKYLLYHTNEVLLNENCIESFSYLLAIDDLFSFIDLSDQNNLESSELCLNKKNAYINRDGMSILFYDYVVNNLNFICNGYANIETNMQLGSVTNKRKTIDLLFKFLIYFYSVLNELSEIQDTGLASRLIRFLDQSNSKSQNYHFSIYKQLDSIKCNILYLLSLPINLKFNSVANFSSGEQQMSNFLLF